ncbi:MAG: CaiB/BaiF CoA transferase family protein [Pseudorhodoplanes sp.]
MFMPRASQALSRFTVLDLTRVRAGPTCVRQLADWGANVVKIEPPDAAKDSLGAAREAGDFQNLHRNKRSLALDLKTTQCHAAFLRLASKADVLVENFRPDIKTRLKIDYPDLRAINSRLVYASISGFGQSGPYRDRPGFDQIAQGLGGIMSVTGLPGQGPVRVGTAMADLSAGLFAAMGILTALLEREQSGEGQQVETSLLEAQIFMLDFQAARWLVDGVVPPQAGNNHPTSIPTGVYATRDGHINIATSGEAIWERFCRACGAETLLARSEYRTMRERAKNRDALNAEIEALISQKTSAEWIDILNAAGVPCGPIYRIDEVFADPQVRHLGMAAEMKSRHGTRRVLRQPVSLSRTPSTIAMPTPERGEHTEDILKEFGFDESDITALRQANAI